MGGYKAQLKSHEDSMGGPRPVGHRTILAAVSGLGTPNSAMITGVADGLTDPGRNLAMPQEFDA